MPSYMNPKSMTPYGFNKKILKTKEERMNNTKISKKQAINRYIKKVEEIVLRADDHVTFKEYWKLGMFLIEHNRVNSGLEYLKCAIDYKESSQHNCAYHQLSVYNNIIKRFQKKK